MSAFAQVARVLLLVALCCSAAYADMYPDRPQPAIVLAAASLPDSNFATRSKARDIAVPDIGATKSNVDRREGDKPLSSEPFGSPTSAVLPADVSLNWHELQSRIEADEKSLAACRADDSACSRAARRFISIVAYASQQEGRARLGTLNRAVNLSIRPVSDIDQYGYPDYWASPLQTLSSEAGDCEDYAIVKYVALREMGFDASDLRFVIVRDIVRQADHAVIAVRDGQGWLILDNRTMAILNSEDVRHYQPLFSMDQQNIRAFASLSVDSITDR